MSYQMWRHWVMRRNSSSVNCESSYWFFCSLHVRSLLCFGRLPLHIEMGSTSGIGWEAIYGEFLHRTGSAKIRCIFLLLSAIVKIGGYFVGNKKGEINQKNRVQYNLFCGLPHQSLASLYHYGVEFSNYDFRTNK